MIIAGARSAFRERTVPHYAHLSSREMQTLADPKLKLGSSCSSSRSPFSPLLSPSLLTSRARPLSRLGRPCTAKGVCGIFVVFHSKCDTKSLCPFFPSVLREGSGGREGRWMGGREGERERARERERKGGEEREEREFRREIFSLICGLAIDISLSPRVCFCVSFCDFQTLSVSSIALCLPSVSSPSPVFAATCSHAHTRRHTHIHTCH
jgi:hypothetical protein